MHIHINLVKAPVSPQGCDPPWDDPVLQFCAAEISVKSQEPRREKVHKYALNVYSEVYKDPWWPTHEQCGVMWSLRDAAEEQDPGCSVDSSTDGAVLQCSCRRQDRWCCFLSLLLFDKVGSGKMSHECVAKCITCGVFDHGQRRTESTTDGSLDSDCGLYWHPMVDHDRGGSWP